MLRLAVAVLALTVAGCGATPPSPPDHGCTVPVQAMTYDDPQKLVRLVIAANGDVSANGKLAGRIRCRELSGADGTLLVTVKDDGTLVGGAGPTWTFDGDSLVARGDPATRISLAEDGSLVFAGKGGVQPYGAFRGSPLAKRAALLAWSQLYFPSLAR